MNPFTEIKKNLPGKWCKGQLYRTVYKVTGAPPIDFEVDLEQHACILGHLTNVMGHPIHRKNSPVELLDKVAFELFPDRVDHNCAEDASWTVNDHPDTTEEDMLSIVEKCEVLWNERVE